MKCLQVGWRKELSSGPRKVDREQLSIEWELGIRDDGYVPGQVTYDAPEISDLYKALTLKRKFLSDPKFAFTLEAYANDTHAPNILPKESNRVLQSIIDY